MFFSQNASNNKVQRTPLVSFLALLTFLIVGFFVGQLLIVGIGLTYTEFDFYLFQIIVLNLSEYPDFKVTMLLMQAGYSICLFILTPFFFIKYYYKKNPFSLLVNTKNKSKLLTSLILTILIGISYMPLSGVFVYWNEIIQLPSFLSDFEQILKDKEEELRKISSFIVNFNSFPQFLLGVFVIAVLPGIGEELLFRGVIQKQIHQISGNIHIGIWVSAFLFGAFHFQFYGIIPRMFLGVLFGYLYVWSGSLWIPIVAHFINNAVSLLLVYLFQLGKVTTDLESPEQISLELALTSLVITSILIFYF